MRKASRLFEIIQILRLANRPVTAQTIADRLEVTVRSIYRDIAALQAMRVPIEGGRGIGYILRSGFDLPPLMFSIEESEAMVLALALLQRTGDSQLKKAAERLSDKIAFPLPASRAAATMVAARSSTSRCSTCAASAGARLRGPGSQRATW